MNAHRFRSLVFDVEVTTRAQAGAVQHRLSRFGRDVLPDLIDKGLAGQSLVTDRVELDLGCLDSDKLEQQIAERLLTLLRSLSPRDSAPGASETQPDAAPPGRVLSDLAHYLTSGQPPWTMPAQPGGIGEMMSRMQDVPVSELRDWWPRFQDNPEAVKRLALAINRQEFLRFLTRIGRYDPGLADSGEQLRQRLGWSPVRFDPIWRMAVLRGAMEFGGAQDETELTILKTMQALLRDWPAGLGFAAPADYANDGASDDPAIENATAAHSLEPAQAKIRPDTSGLLACVLEGGIAQGVAPADRPELVVAFRKALETDADGLAKSLRSVEEQPALIAWMIGNLSGEALEQIVIALCPASATVLCDLLRQSRRLSAPLDGQVWRAVLWVALQDHAANDPVSAMRRVLARMDIRCGLPPAETLALLVPVGPGRAEAMHPALRGVLAALGRDHPVGETTTSAPATNEASGADKHAFGQNPDNPGGRHEPSWRSIGLPLPWSRDDLEPQVGKAATLLLYLRYGIGAPPSQAEAHAHLQHVLSSGGLAMDELLLCLRSVAGARLRLAGLVSPVGQKSVLSAFGGDTWPPETVASIESAVARMSDVSAAAARLIVSRAILDAVCTEPPQEQRITVVRRLLTLVAQTVGRMDGAADLAVRLDTDLPELAQELRRQAGLRPHVPSFPPTAPIRGADRREPDPLQSTGTTETRRTALQEPWLVENAGSVLLWPFLPRYFSALSMLGERGFASEAHRHRAIRLVHFLATSARDAADHRLALTKVLCGLPPDAPIWPADGFTDAETDLSADLLYAVTQAWPGLENTSALGLRQTFLARTGLLQPKSPDTDATLRVEAGPYDMLLDRLTWPVSVVSLDWMAGPLHVRWGAT